MPLVLQYCSDLHLEFELNKKNVAKYPLQPCGDVLLLAGDIVPFAEMDKHSDFFSFVADNFEHIYWVPGNHEYYHSDISDRSGQFHEKIRSNVSLVNNIAIAHNGAELIFSTLWSQVSPADEWQVQRAMSDFHLIEYNGHRFAIADFNRLHNESLQFIEAAVAASALADKVVVTHHIPTFMHYPPQFKGDILSQAFATELSSFIDGSGIHSWIFGHHHYNAPEFKIGDTHMLTNQLGYVKHGEHIAFDRSRVLRFP